MIGNILVLSSIGVLVGFAVKKMHFNHKNKKGCCGCSGCPHKKACNKR